MGKHKQYNTISLTITSGCSFTGPVLGAVGIITASTSMSRSSFIHGSWSLDTELSLSVASNRSLSSIHWLARYSSFAAAKSEKNIFYHIDQGPQTQM